MRGENEFDPQQNSERELSLIGQSVSHCALEFTLIYRVLFLCLHVKIRACKNKVRYLLLPNGVLNIQGLSDKYHLLSKNKCHECTHTEI